jgi:hypothetical protein
MHRINHETADANHNGDGKAGFTAGSTASGIPTTRLTPEWCNALQEEIANTIEVAGLTLDPANNSQMAQAVQALASSYAFTGAWSDIAGKPTFAPVATSGAYGDLSGKPDLNAYLAKSEVSFVTPTYPGTFGPNLTLYRFNNHELSGFGETSGYGAYSDFNAPVGAYGWTFVAGTTNAPPHGGANGGFRCRLAIGLEYADNGLEMAIGRQSAGGDFTSLYLRHITNGAFGNWSKVSAGNADTVGGMSATQLSQAAGVRKWLNIEPTTNVIRDSYGVSSITDHATGLWTIHFSSYFANAGYAASGFSHGNSGYPEVVGADSEWQPHWGTDALRIEHRTSGVGTRVDAHAVAVICTGR